MILTSFLIGLTLALAGTFFVVVRGIELWRQARGTGKRLTAELGAFEERSARTERLLAESERAGQELEAALARLRVSRARLDVLLGSLEAAQRRTRWLRLLVPLR